MNRNTVLITGSSRGIGEGIALKFARENYNVVINCINSSEKLDKLKSQIENYNVDCLSFVGDMSDYNTTKTLFSQIEDRFGGLDILINNAGISYIGLFQDLTPEEWNTIINTNLTSVYNCCHFAVPMMLKSHGGSILNISSVWGITGASCEVAYSATKGAINALTRSLGKELGPSNIRVNAIACGAIDTDMNSFLSKEEMEQLAQDISLGRLGTPQEVAHLVFDLSTKHPYLTGQVVTFDGGWI